MKKSTGSGKEQEIAFSQFLQDAQSGQISDVTVLGGDVHGHFKNDKSQFHVTVPVNYPRLFDILADNKVSVTVKDQNGNSWLPILINFSPVIIIGALWFFMLRQMQSRRQQGAVVRQEPRAPALDAAEEGHVQGRGRRG